MQSKGLPWLAAAGVAGPIACVPVAILAALLRPGYSMRRDNLSGLGVGPHAWIMNVDLIVFGLLMLALALGLWQAFPEGRRPWLGPALFSLWGLGLVTEGIFPTDPPSARSQSIHSILHDAAFVLLTAALVSSCLVFAQRFEQDIDWLRYARYSRLTGVIIPSLLTLFLAMGDSWAWKGLVERIFVALMCLWVEVVALHLRRLTCDRWKQGIGTRAAPEFVPQQP